MRNIRVASSPDLSSLRVVDIGCGHGLYSLYLSQQVREVVGIDHLRARIDTAIATRDALGITNARFVVGDLRDASILEQAGHFDVALAWGFLHRIADPFSFFDTISGYCDLVSLEWRTPMLPLMSRLSLAYHSTSPSIDATNIASDFPTEVGHAAVAKL
jgi:SAM-dependent methyltransferase